MNAKIRSLATYVPERRVSSSEVEDLLRAENPSVRIQPGIIESVTGIRERRYAAEGEYNSHLAARAAERALADANLTVADIDLLIFASAGQDLIEPATAHIVQSMLGTNCRVFDIKNACNSFINALQVAEAMIASGKHMRVLIATGEVPSVAVKWQVADRDDFKRSFAGYTLGDAGAAAVLERADDISGIIASAGTADSTRWDAGTLPGGGSRHPRGDEWSYFAGDGAALKAAFESIGPGFVHEFLKENGIAASDLARIFIHQVSIPYLESFITALDFDSAKVARTVDRYGNTAAATLPLGIRESLDEGVLNDGDLILLVGLAGGISLEAMLIRW